MNGTRNAVDREGQTDAFERKASNAARPIQTIRAVRFRAKKWAFFSELSPQRRSRRLRAARTPKETRATDALAPTLAPIIMCALSAFLLVVLAGGGF